MPLTRLPRLRPRKPKKDHTFFHRQQFNKLKPSGSPELRWYYGFDGIDDYIAIPQSDLVAGDTVTFSFVAPGVPSTGYLGVLSTDAAYDSVVRINNDNTIAIFKGTATLDGNPINSGVTQLPTDSAGHSIVYTASGNIALTIIGAQSDGAGGRLRFIYFPAYDIDIQAVSGNRFYAIDDGPGAVEIVDSISGENGTPNNFNDSRWYEGV
jgi:hypothetical protein